MSNVFDYLSWRGDLSFKNSPVNEIDLFLFSQIAVANLDLNSDDCISFRIILDSYIKKNKEKDKLGVLQSEFINPMMFKLKDVKRFAEISIANQTSIFSNENCEQFSATTFVLSTKEICVAFRATDDTITGWRENCNLAIKESVPSQKDAKLYLEKVASVFQSYGLWVCGHSKGGNLAISCAVNASSDVKNRIKGVYSFDGPGFRKSFLEKEEYNAIKDKITTVVSQNSIIGLLMDLAGTRKIVKSNVMGPLAHDGFNWEVLRTSFVSLKSLSSFSKSTEKALKYTINSMTEREKEKFTEELFSALFSTGAQTLSDLKKAKLADTISILLEISGSASVRKFFSKLFAEYSKNTVLKIKQKRNK